MHISTYTDVCGVQQATVLIRLLLYTYLEASFVLGAGNPAVAVSIQHIKRKLRASHAHKLGFGDEAVIVFVKLGEPCIDNRSLVLLALTCHKIQDNSHGPSKQVFIYHICSHLVYLPPTLFSKGNHLGPRLEARRQARIPDQTPPLTLCRPYRHPVRRSRRCIPLY